MDESLDEKIKIRLVEKREKTIQLRNKMRRDFFDLKIKILDRKYDLLKQITLISVGVLGLTSIISKSIKEVIIFDYFIVSIFLYIVVILFSLSYWRGKTDSDFTGLENNERELSSITEKQINIIDEYILEEKFTEASYDEYWKKLLTTPEIKKLIKEEKNLNGEEKKVSKELDYSLEFIIFLFSSASFFILISFINIHINICAIILIICSILIFSFIDFTIYISKFFNRLFSFIKKKL